MLSSLFTLSLWSLPSSYTLPFYFADAPFYELWTTSSFNEKKAYAEDNRHTHSQTQLNASDMRCTYPSIDNVIIG